MLVSGSYVTFKILWLVICDQRFVNRCSTLITSIYMFIFLR